MSKSMTKVLSAIQKMSLEVIDLKFSDVQGRWRHVTLPAHSFSSRTFFEGVCMDESQFYQQGFAAKVGELILVPDGETFQCDPFRDMPTGSVICNIIRAGDRSAHIYDTRSVAKRAQDYLMNTGIADESRWTTQLEFQIADKINYKNEASAAQYSMESGELNSNGQQSLATKEINYKIRAAMTTALERSGIPINQHCSKETNGGSKIELSPQGILPACDAVMLVKYMLRMLAGKFGKIATFMPLTVYNRQGNGMPIKFHLYNRGHSIFFEKTDGPSHTPVALNYIAGLLSHAPSLMAFTNPSTNSYKRILTNGISTMVRTQNHTGLPNERQLEVKFPDATCNPYLATAALLMAGLDGIKRKLDPSTVQTASTPRSLSDALEALKSDHDYLLEGNVFSRELIGLWSEKKKEEALNIEKRPHPFELEMYCDI